MGWRVAHFRPARVLKGGEETWRTAVEGDGAGFPDLVLARNGRIIIAELKSDRGTVSDEQQKWLDAFGESDRRVTVTVWRPRDWATIERMLRRV